MLIATLQTTLSVLCGLLAAFVVYVLILLALHTFWPAWRVAIEARVASHKRGAP